MKKCKVRCQEQYIKSHIPHLLSNILVATFQPSKFGSRRISREVTPRLYSHSTLHGNEGPIWSISVAAMYSECKGLCTLARSATQSQSGAVSRPRTVTCNKWDKMQVHTLTRSNQILSDCVRSDVPGRI